MRNCTDVVRGVSNALSITTIQVSNASTTPSAHAGPSKLLTQARGSVVNLVAHFRQLFNTYFTVPTLQDVPLVHIKVITREISTR